MFVTFLVYVMLGTKPWASCLLGKWPAYIFSAKQFSNALLLVNLILYLVRKYFFEGTMIGLKQVFSIWSEF